MDKPWTPPLRQTPWPLIVAGLVIMVLTLNWVAAVARFQVNLLFWDQWDFCDPLFRDHSWLELFTQRHGPHRQGLAFVLTSWVMVWGAWDSRVESLWIVSLLVVAAVLGVVWKWRLTGRFGWFDLWIPIGALSMLHWETIIGVPNASHGVFPLLLLVLSAVVLTRPLESAGRWAALGVIGSVSLLSMRVFCVRRLPDHLGWAQEWVVICKTVPWMTNR